ncbi:putative Ig domain-containing protein, partial [Brucella intermedia]|uniref:putative Ig domain-containing protein n=1 Tax=Brucella intermedia TaxID=94625 RepID=UPI00235EFBCD
AGTYTFWLGATDSEGFGGEASGTNGWRQYTLTIAPPSNIAINPPTLPGGKLGAAYPTQTLIAAGGTGPFAWNVTEGTLPSGLVLNSVGQILGIPTASGTYSFTVTVTDESDWRTFNKQYSIKIAPVIDLDLSALPGGKQDIDYGSHKVTATGSTGFTYEITGLPDGLTASGDTVSGTPTKAGTFPVTVKAT